jgi:hypothetical protein
MPTSYNASSNVVGTGRPSSSHGFPSQGQVGNPAFEGYKY